MPLAVLELSTWNPLTVCLAIYVLGNVAVMVIRALRGDPAKTALEQQISQLVDRVSTNEKVVTDIARDLVPSAAVSDMLKGRVDAALPAVMQQVREQVAKAVAPPPANSSSPFSQTPPALTPPPRQASQGSPLDPRRTAP